MKISSLTLAATLPILSCQPNNPEKEDRTTGESEIKNALTQLNLNLHWYQKPLRIVQIVLREPDAKDYDVMELICLNSFLANE